MPRAASFFATLAHLGWFDLPRPEAPGEDASDAVARWAGRARIRKWTTRRSRPLCATHEMSGWGISTTLV